MNLIKTYPSIYKYLKIFLIYIELINKNIKLNFYEDFRKIKFCLI